MQYDTIFHEHLSYLTAGSIAQLMASVGMKVTDVTLVRMNGGSLLCEVVHEEAAVPRGDQSLIEFENFIGLNSPAGWQGFAGRVRAQREAFLAMLGHLRTQGRRVVAYGAAAKCMTMLNYCGITTDLVAAIGDANPRKQGMLCPGVRIPVVSPDALLEMRPDVIVIGAWNWDEIIRVPRAGGGVLVPLPVPVWRVTRAFLLTVWRFRAAEPGARARAEGARPRIAV